MQTSKYWKTLTLMVLLTLQAGSALAGTQQPIEVDNSKGKAPMVIQAGNGVPVVNIQTPNNRGLSHNQYKNFNVTSKGLIFNNSRENVKTQLGGYITKNNYLAGSSAKTILNEVTSNMASKINGFMEIAGQKANLIISNPNGIQINNGGYINVNRGILTTGRPKIGSDGNLNGFSVERGTVEIGGLGFDARQASKAKIYAQAVKLNAKIFAENLNIVTGKNEIDGEGNVTASDNTEYEGVSLDVGAIGGMYAGVIKLVGTAKGLGVNMEGEIYAQRQLVMTEDGRVAVKENGKIVSDGTAEIETKAKLVNRGEIISQEELQISAKKLVNKGDITGTGNGNITVAKEFKNVKDIVFGGDVKVSANKLTDEGKILAEGTGTIAVAKLLTLTDGAELVTKGALNIESKKLQNEGKIGTEDNAAINVGKRLTNAGEIIVGSELNVKANNLYNTGSFASVADSKYNVSGTLNNAGLLNAANNYFEVGTLNNNNSGKIYGDDIGIKATTLNNTADEDASSTPVVAARNDLQIEAAEVNNKEKALLFALNDIKVTSDILNNESAKIESGNDLIFNVGTLTNKDIHFDISDELEEIGTYEENQILDGNGNFICDLNGYTIMPRGTHMMGQVSSTNQFYRCFPSFGGGELFKDKDGDFLLNILVFPGTKVVFNRPNLSITGLYLKRWKEHYVTTTYYKTVVKHSEESGMVAGNNIAFIGDKLINDKGKIVAGEELNIDSDKLENISVDAYVYKKSVGYEDSYDGTRGGCFDPTTRNINDTEPIKTAEKVSYSSISTNETSVSVENKTEDKLSSGYAVSISEDIAEKLIAEENITSSIYTNAVPEAEYYIEVDPQFANYSTWLSSDYFMGQMKLDPSGIDKRIGDGFYEQQLIKEQLIDSVGVRLLEGFSSDEEQYRTFMDNAVNFANVSGAKIGEKLTEEQQATLKEPIVWYITKTVQLPDGRVVNALAPQVYLPTDMQDNVTTAMLGGQEINIITKEDIVNTGTIKSNDILSIVGGKITNITGTLKGKDVALQADEDISSISGNIFAENNLTLEAGGNIDISTNVKKVGMNYGTKDVRDQISQVKVGGDILLNAGKDVVLGAANVSAGGNIGIYSEGDTLITDILLKETEKYKDAIGLMNHTKTDIQGSTVSAGGDIEIYSDNNAVIRSSSVQSKKNNGKIDIYAEKNIDVVADALTDNKNVSKRFGGNYSGDAAFYAGSNVLGGKQINFNAGENVNIHSSEIAGMGSNADVNIVANKDTNIIADENIAKYTDVKRRGYTNSEISTSHSYSNISATGNVNVISGSNIDIKASNVIGTGDNSEVNITALENINITSGKSIHNTNYRSGQKHTESVVNESSAIGGNKVNIGANNDVTLQTANIAASGENAELNIGAGNNINLTASKAVENDYHTISHGYEINNSSQDEGTNLVSEGKLNLVANNDINLKAAYADGDEVNITAGNNINIEAGDASSYYEYYYHKTSRHGLSKKSVTIHDVVSKETKVGTDIGGNTLNIQAGNDINVKGSNVIGVGDVNMLALENANIDSVTEKTGETHIKKVKKSGFLSGGGFGFTIGKQSSTDELQKVTTAQKGSTVGSVTGDVNITTGDKLNVTSSDIIAGGNINLTGSEVKIDAASDTYTYNYKHEEKTSGLHISFGGGVVGTVQENIVQSLERSRQVSNEKLSALYDIKAASKVKETGAVLKDAFNPGTVTKYTGDVVTGADGSMTMGTKEVKKDVDWGHINVGFGNSKSTYTEHGESSTAHSSGVSAGEDVNITATEKDIDIKGSNVTGENINLTAKGNVNITAKENISTFNSKDKKSGSEIGVSFSVNGISVYGNAYGMKEKGEGTTTTYTGSNVTAKDTLNIESGADTNIIGSKASGEKVNADVGGNLNIESLQDRETQKLDKSSWGASGSIGLSGNINGKGGFNFNAGTNKMESDYNSVTEQAGIYAGSRGFDIYTEGNTNLKGGIIDSKAGYEDNTLNTGTITFDDIDNKAEYSTSGRGMNIQKTFGKGGMTDEQKAWEGVTPSTGIGTKDEDESTTKSAIAEARINIMKPEKQRQDITKLDRNTTRTLNKLGKIFDKEKVEEKQELAGQFQELWHTTVGDLMQDKTITDDQRKALNILGGAIAAELGGADFKAGLTGGATTELLQSAFSQIKDPSLRKVAVAITAAMVAKGTGQEASTAANVGVAIQKYNHDLHPEETAEIMANVKQLTGEERDKYIKEWVKILEDKTEPDAFKVSISAGVGIVGVQKDFIFTKDANPEFFADDGTLDMKEVGKYIKDLVSKSSSYKPDLSFSISCSALHLVDLNDPNRKYNERDLNNILGGESYGISGYFLMGGGITKPYKPEAGNSGVVIIEKGGGTPQININFGIGENIGEVIKDKIKNPGQMD